MLPTYVSFTLGFRLAYVALGVVMALLIGWRLWAAWKTGEIDGKGVTFHRNRQPILYWTTFLLLAVFGVIGLFFIAAGIWPDALCLFRCPY
jgi:hypothetical protein